MHRSNLPPTYALQPAWVAQPKNALPAGRKEGRKSQHFDDSQRSQKTLESIQESFQTTRYRFRFHYELRNKIIRSQLGFEERKKFLQLLSIIDSRSPVFFTSEYISVVPVKFASLSLSFSRHDNRRSRKGINSCACAMIMELGGNETARNGEAFKRIKSVAKRGRDARPGER